MYVVDPYSLTHIWDQVLEVANANFDHRFFNGKM